MHPIELTEKNYQEALFSSEYDEAKRQIDLNFYDNDFSSWMGRLPSSLKSRPINQLTLPKTHDSGAYQITFDHYAPGQTKIFSILFLLGSQFRCIRTTIQNWTVSQSAKVQEQLSLGIRNFDLRLTYCPFDEQFYISHTYYCEKASDVLDQIKAFLKDKPSEVVVLNITPDYEHRMDLTPERAEFFLGKYQDVFGELLHPARDTFSPDTTLKNMVASGKRIITYYFGDLPNHSSDNGVKTVLFPFLWDINQNIGEWINTSQVDAKLRGIAGQLSSMVKNIHDYNNISFTLTPQTNDVIASIIAPIFNRNFRRKNLLDLTKQIQVTIPDFIQKHISEITVVSSIATDFPTKDFVEEVLKVNYLKLRNL